MSTSSHAGKPGEPWMLSDIRRLVTPYYVNRPDPTVPTQRVAFAASGHGGGSSPDHAFDEAYFLAISEAICLYLC
jgi:phosphoglucomutase